MNYLNDDELYHFGIKGMKWGVRRFQNRDGTRTSAGKKRYNESGSTDREARKAKIKKAAKIAAAVAGTAALGYGAYRLAKSHNLKSAPGDAAWRISRDAKYYSEKARDAAKSASDKIRNSRAGQVAGGAYRNVYNSRVGQSAQAARRSAKNAHKALKKSFAKAYFTNPIFRTATNIGILATGKVATNAIRKGVKKVEEKIDKRTIAKGKPDKNDIKGRYRYDLAILNEKTREKARDYENRVKTDKAYRKNRKQRRADVRKINNQHNAAYRRLRTNYRRQRLQDGYVKI